MVCGVGLVVLPGALIRTKKQNLVSDQWAARRAAILILPEDAARES